MDYYELYDNNFSGELLDLLLYQAGLLDAACFCLISQIDPN